MSEPDKPKHRWFQFHLSTSILTMFVLGGILWMNIEPYQAYRYDIHDDAQHLDGVAYGKPFCAVAIHKESFELNWVGIVLDIIYLGGLVFVIAFFSELLIRRREARKT